MRIDGIPSPNLQPAVEDSNHQPAPSTRPAAGNHADRLEISGVGQQLSSSRVSETPEARSARIEQLTSAVETGNYNVDANQVADAILNQSTVGGE